MGIFDSLGPIRPSSELAGVSGLLSAFAERRARAQQEARNRELQQLQFIAQMENQRIDNERAAQELALRQSEAKRQKEQWEQGQLREQMSTARKGIGDVASVIENPEAARQAAEAAGMTNWRPAPAATVPLPPNLVLPPLGPKPEPDAPLPRDLSFMNDSPLPPPRAPGDPLPPPDPTYDERLAAYNAAVADHKGKIQQFVEDSDAATATNQAAEEAVRGKYLADLPDKSTHTFDAQALLQGRIAQGQAASEAIRRAHEEAKARGVKFGQFRGEALQTTEADLAAGLAGEALKDPIKHLTTREDKLAANEAARLAAAGAAENRRSAIEERKKNSERSDSAKLRTDVSSFEQRHGLHTLTEDRNKFFDMYDQMKGYEQSGNKVQLRAALFGAARQMTGPGALRKDEFEESVKNTSGALANVKTKLAKLKDGDISDEEAAALKQYVERTVGIIRSKGERALKEFDRQFGPGYTTGKYIPDEVRNFRDAIATRFGIDPEEEREKKATEQRLADQRRRIAIMEGSLGLPSGAGAGTDAGPAMPAIDGPLPSAADAAARPSVPAVPRIQAPAPAPLAPAAPAPAPAAPPPPIPAAAPVRMPAGPVLEIPRKKLPNGDVEVSPPAPSGKFGGSFGDESFHNTPDMMKANEELVAAVERGERPDVPPERVELIKDQIMRDRAWWAPRPAPSVFPTMDLGGLQVGGVKVSKAPPKDVELHIGDIRVERVPPGEKPRVRRRRVTR